MATQNVNIFGDDHPRTVQVSHPNRDEKDLERHHSVTKETGAGHASYHGIDTRNVQPGADEIYDSKIAILNEALIDLGMGRYQWMVFLTTGLGWFIDNVCKYLSPEPDITIPI
jgi:hypothetical protein